MMIPILILTIGFVSFPITEGKSNDGIRYDYQRRSNCWSNCNNINNNNEIQLQPLHRTTIGKRLGITSNNMQNHHVSKHSKNTLLQVVTTISRGGADTDNAPTTSKIDYSYYDVGGTDDVMDTRPDISDEKVLLNSGIDYDHLIDGAYGWLCNLGAPSALVAGAVIASIYENMNNPDSNYQPNHDNKITGFAKKLVRWLLITAFACEALCIFVTTVTGTMLLSEDLDSMLHQGIVRTARTPLQFLHDHFEFEYITGHIMFLQGLLNWFTAIAVSHAIPTMESSASTTAINQFLAVILLSTTVFMLSIYNKHIYFYSNYGTMLYRWFHLVAARFVVWPPRPLSFVLVPAMILSIVMGIKVFLFQDNDNDNKIEDTKTKSKKSK